MESVNHIQLTIHPSQVRPILRALLLAIFFHRTLDAMEPETLELLESHISCVPNSIVSREISNKIEEFALQYLEGGQDHGELAVVFLQKKSKKGWFAVTEELVPWEEHLITLNFCHSPKTPLNPLPGALLQIATFCLKQKAMVPPLTGTTESQSSNVSYQIMIAPPSPNDLFAPSSPPSYPTRLTSPPPAPSPSTTPATAVARDLAISHRPMLENPNSARRTSSPTSATLGYFEQAKDGLRAVGAKAGAGVGWGGRAMGAAFGRNAGGY
ncbi:uncharacterized protein IAS62_004421 [Cryptococcus decagattii]|uniref:Autophagy-related protein 101 n=1 Tax=Cryptococcus decagattii TaxID=1859122 RepID=A0ABZ2B0A6_9TREE